MLTFVGYLAKLDLSKPLAAWYVAGPGDLVRLILTLPLPQDLLIYTKNLVFSCVLEASISGLYFVGPGSFFLYWASPTKAQILSLPL